jgi:hypothetical protein
MSTNDYDEQQRQAQAVADMQQAAVIESGTRQVGSKDVFLDEYGTLQAKLVNMTAFNEAALAHDEIGKIVTRYAADPDRLDRLSKLPIARAVVDIGRVEAGLPPTSHEPLWQAEMKNRGHLSKEDFLSPLSDRQTDKQWNEDFDRYHAEREAKSVQPLGSRHRRG